MGCLGAGMLALGIIGVIACVSANGLMDATVLFNLGICAVGGILLYLQYEKDQTKETSKFFEELKREQDKVQRDRDENVQSRIREQTSDCYSYGVFNQQKYRQYQAKYTSDIGRSVLRGYADSARRDYCYSLGQVLRRPRDEVRRALRKNSEKLDLLPFLFHECGKSTAEVTSLCAELRKIMNAGSDPSDNTLNRLAVRLKQL